MYARKRLLLLCGLCVYTCTLWKWNTHLLLFCVCTGTRWQSRVSRASTCWWRRPRAPSLTCRCTWWTRGGPPSTRPPTCGSPASRPTYLSWPSPMRMWWTTTRRSRVSEVHPWIFHTLFFSFFYVKGIVRSGKREVERGTNQTGTSSGSRVLMTENWKKFTAEKRFFFSSKIAIYH